MLFDKVQVARASLNAIFFQPLRGNYDFTFVESMADKNGKTSPPEQEHRAQSTIMHVE
jgi:hypothetical protein